MGNVRAFRPSPRWSAEAKDDIRRMWAEGMSASIIARRMGDTTRNAIIGVVHRMGLSNKRRTPDGLQMRRTSWTPARRERHRQKLMDAAAKRKAEDKIAPRKPGTFNARPARPAEKEAGMNEYRAAVASMAAIPHDPAKAVTIDELEPHHCRWPLGDPREPGFKFCGCKKIPGLSYCSTHAARSLRLDTISKSTARIIKEYAAA